MNELTVFVGRQPIFDRKGNIYAYELLYRNSEENKFPNINPEKATIELLTHTFLTIGIDQLVGKTKSLINFSKQLLRQGVADQLDPRLVIIEVLESVQITPEIIRILKRLKKSGFKIALDDFTLKHDQPCLAEVFRVVDIVKIDFLHTDQAERRRIEAVVKKHPKIILLAEKIETDADYAEAKKFGYLLFQGYYFSRPEIITGRELPPNYALHFHLLQKFNEAEPNVDQISELLMRDISLSYKLLRYINSLTFGIPNQVSSIRQAIMLMGLKEASRWLNILLLREVGRGSGRGREKALIDQSLARAKTCELLAKHTGKRNPDEYFLTGLFSLVDLMMKSHLENILPQLALSDTITLTLLGEETEISPYLRLCEKVETLDLTLIREQAETINIEEEKLSKIITEAQRWATFFD